MSKRAPPPIADGFMFGSKKDKKLVPKSVADKRRM